MNKVIALPLNEDQQIEIVRIVADGDEKAALEFIKAMNDEIIRRETAHCGTMLDFTPLK